MEAAASGNAASAFDRSSVKTEEVDIEKLHAKIGEFTLENDFWNKRSGASAVRAQSDDRHRARSFADSSSRHSPTLAQFTVLHSGSDFAGRLGVNAQNRPSAHGFPFMGARMLRDRLNALGYRG